MRNALKTLLVLLAVAGGIVTTFHFAPAGGIIRAPSDAEIFGGPADQAELWSAASPKESRHHQLRTWVKATAKEIGSLLWVITKQIFWFVIGIVWTIISALRIAELVIGILGGLILAALLNGHGWPTLRRIFHYPTTLIAGGFIVAAMLAPDLRVTLLTLAGATLIIGTALHIARRMIRAATAAATP